MATDSDQFMSAKRFAMENDLVSQVAATGKPQILGRVNPASEKELLRYYESPAICQVGRSACRSSSWTAPAGFCRSA